MNWFIQLVAKYDVPANVLYKIASPHVIRELKHLKDKVKRERHVLDQYPLDQPIELSTPVVNKDDESQPTKMASVSFYVADSHKISQPKNIHTISWDMAGWASKNIPHDIFRASPMTNLMPDGYDFDKFTGTINIYVETDPKAVVPYVEKYIQEELQPLGIQAHIRNIDTSAMNGLPTIRVEIIDNETQSVEKLPEFNIANANFDELNKMLNLGDYGGSISAEELLARISMARGNEDLYTRPEESGQFPGKAQWTSFGLDKEKITRYLDMLEQIATKALEMNNSTVVWS